MNLKYFQLNDQQFTIWLSKRKRLLLILELIQIDFHGRFLWSVTRNGLVIYISKQTVKWMKDSPNETSSRSSILLIILIFSYSCNLVETDEGKGHFSWENDWCLRVLFLLHFLRFWIRHEEFTLRRKCTFQVNWYRWSFLSFNMAKKKKNACLDQIEIVRLW